MTPIQFTERELLQMAAPILKEARSLCRTSHTILNRITELGPLHLLQLETEYQRLGPRFIEFLAHSILRRKAGAACDQASMNLKLTHPITAMKLATLKFGVGECDELATVVALKTARIAPSHLVISGPKGWNQVEPLCANLHAFVLWGVDDIELEGAVKKSNGVFSKTLLRLSCGVIIDPLLGVACLTKDLNTEGRILMDYARIWGTTQIAQTYFSTPETCPIEGVLKEEAEAVYELALKLFAKAEHPDNELICRFLGHKMKANLSSGCKWRVDYNEGTLKLWTRGTKEAMNTIASELEEREIRYQCAPIKQTSDYCLFLSDPNPNLILGINQPQKLSGTEEKKE